MKENYKAETKVDTKDAIRVRTEARGYTPAKGKALGASETGSSAKLGGRGSSGNKSRHHRYGGFKGTALVVLLTFSMVFASLLGAFADDLVNTVPNEEVTSGNFYGNQVNTYFSANGMETKYDTPGYGPYAVDGVLQSRSATSATSFAAGLPLGTIFIDQSKIGEDKGTTKVVSSDENIIAGLTVVNGKMSYDGRRDRAIKMEPSKINRLDGDLFTVTFEDAAILPNGTRADLVATYSNARILVDQRYASAPAVERYYHGAVYLAQGNAIAYGGTDNTDFRNVAYASDAQSAVNTTVRGLTGNDQSFTNGNSQYPSVGLSIDISYQILNKDKTPAAGTFVFAICGINLDRDPDKGTQNNVGKPLWYSYANSFGSEGENGKLYSYFTEAMEIRDGQISDNVYVRPNNALEDNPAKVTGLKGSYYYANIARTADGNLKFIGNDDRSDNTTSYSGHDDSYNSGFVTLADAANGFKVTATGHGNISNSMNSKVFNSKQIWYRYTDSSGPHGKIQTTNEGNWGGKLNDGGEVLTPDGPYDYDAGKPTKNRATYVVAEGKTVTYTMTPDIGYKASRVLINGQPVKINGEHVSSMKKGDSVTVTTAAGKEGTLKYEEDGTYTFIFPYALNNEDIHVDWEPTTADLYIAKIWKDNDDEDGLRSLIYGGSDKPKFKLQYSTNGGRNWSDVKTGETKNSDIANTPIHPERTYNDQEVPEGKVGGAYKDGTYYIDNGTSGFYKDAAVQPDPDNLVPTYETCQSKTVLEDTTTRRRYVEVGGTYKEVEKADHPFTWEHLPVYTYDDSGTADRPISYRIVEDDDPVHRDYKKAQYFDSQAFELTSEKSKTWNGWQIYKENGSDKYYVLRGDGRYYLVSSSLYENADGVVNPVAPTTQPDKNNLTPVSSNTYRTTDKAIPYQSEEILNEHTVRKLYVDVNKFWNDRDLLDAITTGTNDYKRVELRFILSGETEDGEVDLNEDPRQKKLELTVSPTETGAKYEKIDNYQIFKDTLGNKYANVIDHETATNGYYPVSEGSIDYTKKADVNPLDLSPIINTRYQVDPDRFGVCFNDLPTHDNGKNITYTVKEQFKIGETWYDAGESEVSWVTNGGELNPERDSSHEVKGYETIFSNTPRIEDKYNTLPITIAKRDAKTTNVLLEGAEFTIYRNAITGEKALDNEDVKIEGQKIYTHDSLEYVLRKEAGDTEEKYYTFAKKNDGTYEYTLAEPQPKETDLKVKQGDVKSNVVYTSTQGLAMVEFQEPGTYYIQETKAPNGYTADPKIYAFIVNEKLKTVTLKDVDDDHATKWWEKLYDMLFGEDTAPTTYDNWNKNAKTLTVDDEPLSANILVRKYWEDNDDQDGVRPKDKLADGTTNNPKTPNVILQWTTTAHTADGHPVYQSGDNKKYIHNTTDDKYYEVIEEDTIGTFDSTPEDPQPENVTETSETCQGRKVYKDGSDQKYVFVDEKYHKVTLVDKTGSVSTTAANPQPNEDDLKLIQNGNWTDVIIGTEDPSDPDPELAIERVSYAGGPVKTSQTDAYTWSNVKAYRDGKVVVYRVHETSPLITDGTYAIKYSHTSDTHEKVFTLVNQNGTTHNQTVDVMNKHETRVINIEAYKTWNDEDQTKRQEATLTLWKEVNGARSIVTKIVDGHAESDTGTVPTTDETDPVKTWSDLPAYEMGYPITYSIVETTIDGYKTVYEVDYTKAATDTDPEKEIEEEGSAIDASVVKRTYYTQADKDAGKIPTGKKVGDESTTAAFRIENEETIDIPVKKTWVDGANANVTFELWRTTTPEADRSASNYTESVICYKHNETGNRISVQDYDALPAADKANYTEQRGKNWSPYDPEDATVIVDGWEKVDEYEFAASKFEVSSTGDAEPYTFEDLPRQELDDEGNYHKYTYRILETPKLVRLAADQTDDFKVTNYNLHASSGFANVEVVKELQGRAWNAGGLEDKFYFELDPQSATDTTDPTHTIAKSDIPLPTRTLSRELYQGGDKYYVKDADDMYREVTVDTSTDPTTYTVAKKPANPQPKGLTATGETCEAPVQYAVDSTKTKEVGAIGRAADFKSIEFSDETVIPRGHTVEFNYKVREVFDILGTSLADATNNTGKRDGISYADFDDQGSWTQAEHDLKIIVVNDLDGKMTTTILWDGATETSAVPVFTNKYSSESEAKAWIEKEIANRPWVDYANGNGDAFQYEVLAISGSQLNVPGADHSQGTDDSYTSKPLISNASGNPQDDIQKQSNTEYAFGLTGNKYTGDMLNSSGEGYFIYAISEKDKATSTTDSLGLNNYFVDGLTYDDSTIYAKVKVTDNWDGILSFDVKYYSDAACRTEITNYKVWIQDKFIGGSISTTAADPQPDAESLIETTEKIGDKTVYADANGNRYVKDGDPEYYHEIIGGTETKRLLSQEEIAAMGSMSGDQIKANGYVEKNVAHFINRETVDIPVVKEWKDGPAIEDVNLHLVRHLYEMTASFDESTLTYAAIEAEAKKWKEEEHGGEPFWTTEGHTHIAKRGDFLNDDGTPALDPGSEDTASEKYENIDKFNKDLPKYVKEGGKMYRAVYKLVEDDTSDTYTTTYRSSKEGEEDTEGNSIFLGGETLIVTNTVTATNTANIAAVKQFLGRNWASTDKFDFTLEPAGVGTYNKTTGELTGIDSSDDAKAKVPMPDSATADAVSTDDEVDKNGHLERLASFDEITYTTNDLQYDPVEKHYQGDFYYIMKEKLPDITDDLYPVAYTSSTQTTEKEIENKQLPTMASGEKLKTVKFNNGITYDCDEHTVHVKVRENRTDALQVQIAYDYDEYDDISTGTQYTPVYTNRYDATGEYAEEINKYIMGRRWKDGESESEEEEQQDKFDFRMTPLAGAPFEDADKSEFPAVDTHSDDERDTDLEADDAIHSARGAHVKRLKVTDEDKEIQVLTMPKLKYRLSELGKTVEKAGDLKYSNGTDVPAGMAYDQFVYSFEETNDYLKQRSKDVKDLNIDPDTEYARVTVIDKGDGTLDHYVEIFEDRYCEVPRYKPGTTTPATSPTFVNQLKRDLSITKAWADTPNSDVTMRLKWSVDGEHWYDADKATFLEGQDVTKTIKKDATGDALTVTWTDLPAYANIYSATDQTANDTDLDDLWIYYTITEDPIDLVITRYSEDAYKEGDSYNDSGYEETVNGVNPFKTEDAPSGDSYADRTYNEIIDQLYATNWREETEGTAKVGVVKQYIGKVWEDEEFTFEMNPVKSRLGGASAYTTYENQVAAHETDPKAKVMPVLSNNKATANTGTAPVSVNEHAANFNGLVIKLSDLVVDPADGKEKGEFIYEIKEVIPDGAVEMTEGGKTYFVKKDAYGNIIKYTTDTHTAKIIAVDDGSGNIDITVSYDNRSAGEFVPVYTNYAMMPTPIDGTKTWIGGKKAEHQNGTVELDEETGEIKTVSAPTDKLGLTLKRKLVTSDGVEEPVTHDEAGRKLVVVWVKENPAQPAEPTGYWINSETEEKITDEEYEAITDEDEKAKYTQEMTDPVPESIDTQTGDDPDSTEKGNSGPYTYTIKAEVTEGDVVTGYEDPLLNVCDTSGYEYEYYITETSVPKGYEKSESGMDVVNTNSETDNLKVSKTWDDAQGVDGTRPDKVIVHLYKDVIVPAEEGGQATTKTVQVEVDKKTIEPKGEEKDVWSTGVVFEDLPLYDSNGNVIKYFVLEEGIGGYTATYAANSTVAGDYKDEANLVKVELDGQKDRTDPESETDNPQFIDIKNSLTPATNTVKVTKVWDDQNDIDGARPEDVTFQLWKYVWDPKANNDKGAYKTTEELVSGDSGTGRPATQADVDAGIAEKLGDKVEVEDLTLNGTADTGTDIDTVANETAPTNTYTWNGEWINLPLTENGKTILYIIKEDTTGSAYGTAGTQGMYSEDPCIRGDQIKGYTATNTYTPEVTSFEGIKEWVDGDSSIKHNNSAELPGKLTLWRTNVAPAQWTDETEWTNLGTLDNLNATLVPNAHVDWSSSSILTIFKPDDKFTITGLPKKDGDAKTYYYKVTETPIDGYDQTYDNTELEDEDLKTRTDAIYDGGTVENAAKVGDVEITKKFVYENDKAVPKATLPSGFKIKVSYVWNNPETKKYEKKTDNLTITDDTSVTDGVYKWTLSNVVVGTKVTAEESGYDSPTGYSYVSSTATVNGDDEATHLEENPTYAEFTMPIDAANKKPILKAYNPGEGGDAPASIAFVNTYKRDTGGIEPTKIWDDDSDAADARPEEVTFTITATDGGDLSKTYPVIDNGSGAKVASIDYKMTKDDNTGDTWFVNESGAISIDDLPTHADDGKQICYVVTENNVPDGYQRLYPQAYGAYIPIRLSKDGDYQTAEITNAYSEFEITKQWRDADGDKSTHTTLRPTAAEFKEMLELYAGSQDVTETYKNGLTVTDNNDGTYTAKWTGLRKRVGDDINSAEIVYSAKENPETITGYAEGTYSDGNKALKNGTITNTQLIKVDVVKQWDDKSNHEGRRPDKIKVKLFRNGLPLGSYVTLKKGEAPADGTYEESSDGNTYTWTSVWKDLPYADDYGVKYNYTAVEIDSGATWYEALIGTEPMHQILLSAWKNTDTKDTWVFTIDNKYDDETTGFTVDKIWNDGSDVDKLRPEKIYYRLYQDYEGISDANKQIKTLPTNTTVTITGGEFKTANDGYIEVVTNKNDVTQGTLGRVTIEGLPKYSSTGKLITYSIKEDADVSTPATTTDTPPEKIFGYTTNVDGNSSGGGVTVTNSHTPGEVDVSPKAVKEITGRTFKLGEEFTFKLAVDENSPKNTPTPTPDWVTIEAGAADALAKTMDIPLGTFKFTGADMLGTDGKPVNEKTFIYNLTEVNGGKTYDDLYYDPSTLTLSITVKRNAETAELEIANTDVKWGEDNTDADKTFVNEHGATKKLTLRKVWVDVDADGTVIGDRPTSVEFKVTATIKDGWSVAADDELINAGFTKKNDTTYEKTYELNNSDTAAEDTAHTWQIETDDLPKYDAEGTAVKYEVSEEQVPNYNEPKLVVKNDVYTITNEYKRDDFTGTKVWVDGGKKHDNVTELTDKLTVQRTTTPDEETSWISLPKTGDDAPHIHWNGDGAFEGGNYKQSFTITGLTEYDQTTGNKYTYRVVESAVDGYKAPVYTGTKTDAVYDGGTVTNEKKLINLTAMKTWKDSEDKDGKRTETTLHLYKKVAGETEWTPVEDVTVEKNGKSEEEFQVKAWSITDNTALPAYEGNKLISYRLVEDEVDEYETTYDKMGTDFVIGESDREVEFDYTEAASDQIMVAYTNTYEPETITIEGIKVWDNDPESTTHDNSDEVELTLTRQLDGEDAEEVSEDDAGNEITFVWDDADGEADTFNEAYTVKAKDGDEVVAAKLFQYKNGKKYTYKITETPIEGYATTYADNGALKQGDVTNTYGATASSPTDSDITVNKIYVDNGDPMIYGTDAEKKIINKKKGDEFNFTLKGLSDGTYDGKQTKDASGLAQGTGSCIDTKEGSTAEEGIEISQIAFTELGSYAFELTETKGEQKGVTYDETKYRLIVDVTDSNKDGEWEFAWKVIAKKDPAEEEWQPVMGDDQSKAEFNNSYNNLKTEVIPEITKELDGHKIDSTYAFEFVMFGGPDDVATTGLDAEEKLTGKTSGARLDTETKKATEVVQLKNDGKGLIFTLDDLKKLDGTYAAERTFKYLVYEKGGGTTGVIYDTTPRELKVTLKYVPETETAAEKLEVVFDPAGETGEGKANTGIKIENVYDPNAVQSSVTDDGNYEVKKVINDLNNRDRTPRDEEFTFRLKGQAEGTDGSTQDATYVDMLAVNDGKGNVEFPKVAFEEPGTYAFKMTELHPYDKTIDPYDEWTRTAIAVVTDEGDGTMKVVWTVTAEDGDGAPAAVDQDNKLVTFVNTTVMEEVDIPVRITWVNDTDYDDTVGDQEDPERDPESTAKDRPTEVTVTLRKEVVDKYLYDGDECTIDELLDKLSEKLGRDATMDDVRKAYKDEDVTIKSKKWVDVEEPDNPGTSWSVTLDKDDAEDGDPDNWFSDEFSGLPKYDELGEKIEYKLAQTGIKSRTGDLEGTKTDGLTSSVVPRGYDTVPIEIPVAGTIRTIINTYQVKTISGTKVWVDPEPDKHNNSSEISFTVKRKAEASDEWTVLEEGKDYHVDWKDVGSSKDKQFTIKGLAEYVDPNADPKKIEFIYDVSENAIAGGKYETKYFEADGATETDGFVAGGVIKNIIKQEYVEIHVEKTWYGAATDDVTYKLKSDAESGTGVVATHEFKKSDFDATGGTKTFTFTKTGKDNAGPDKLPKYNLDPNSDNYGKEIVYTVEETPDGTAEGAKFTSEDPSGKGTEDEPFVIKNTSKVDVYAKKVWEGDSEDTSKRANVEFQLYQTVDGAKKAVDQPKAATNGADDDYAALDEVKWENKPYAIDGKTVEYTVEEVSVPENYTMSGPTGEGTEDEPYVITNKLKTDKIDIPVMVDWTDKKNQDGIRPKNVTVTLQSGVTKYEYNGETYDTYDQAKAAADEAQDDYDNIKDKWIKDEDVATKTLDNSNNWKGLFKDVPKTDANGKPIEYKVVETRTDVLTGVDGPETYAIDEAGDTKAPQDGWVITNTHTPENGVTVTVKKIWKGDTEVKSTTRKDVTLYLLGRTSAKKDGVVAYDGGSRKIKVNKSAAVNTEAGTATWNELPKKIDGKELIWEVYEDSIPGYTTEVKQTKGDDGTTEDNEAVFTVTNEYAGTTKTVEATKQWDDDNNRDGMRKNVTFVLMKQVGNNDPEVVDRKTVADEGDNHDQNMTAKWTNLPEMTIGGTETTTDTSYNEVTPQTGDNPQEKEWYVKNGDNYEPTSDTTVKDGTTYYEKVDTDKVTNTDTHAIVYWVVEESVPEGYTSVVIQNEPGKYTVKNIHVPAKTTVSVKKIWNDEDNKEGLRPDHIVFKLKDGEGDVAKAKITKKDTDEGWGGEGKYTWSNLPKYKDGEVIEYSVVELDGDDSSVVEETGNTNYGYTLSAITEPTEGDDLWVFTNTRSKKLVTLKATKVWEESDEDTSKRTDVTFKLVKITYDASSTKIVKTEEVEGSEKTVADEGDHDENMTATWKDLQYTEKGHRVAYTVAEESIDGYTTTVGNVEATDEVEDGQQVFKVNVTNTKGIIPDRGDVIYVDPLNPAGKADPDNMIVKSTRYKTPEEAREAAENKTHKPADPKTKTKDGVTFTFTGWAMNWDDNDNFVLVATYSATPEKKTPIVSYIDPQTGKIVTGDKGKVKKPADPKAKNMQFVGWIKTLDRDGNEIYVARFKPDCSNGAYTGKGKSVPTGDTTSLIIWIIVIGIACVAAIAFAVARVRNSRKE